MTYVSKYPSLYLFVYCICSSIHTQVADQYAIQFSAHKRWSCQNKHCVLPLLSPSLLAVADQQPPPVTPLFAKVLVRRAAEICPRLLMQIIHICKTH